MIFSDHLIQVTYKRWSKDKWPRRRLCPRRKVEVRGTKAHLKLNLPMGVKASTGELAAEGRLGNMLTCCWMVQETW